jgi:2,4-dienoyl-CoA reductase-like NADH-dependent reductase (Old Yellow Enzyme family)
MGGVELQPEKNKPIFRELQFRNLTVKNRLFRSSISGRLDNYNGSGSPARVNFEKRFARGGVGAIISSHVPIRIDSRVLPNYATIDTDQRIPFWREVGERVHEIDGCKFILQLSMSGRQQDIGGIENQKNRDLHLRPLSATGKGDFFNGLPCHSMSLAEIAEAIKDFGRAAERVVEAGLDGIELHSSNGYLFNQFLSSAINDRQDEYGGPLENRYRFLGSVLKEIRSRVGSGVFLSVKLSVIENDNATVPWPLHYLYSAGNTLKESVQIAQWAERDTADAIHVSAGSTFPHPHNPAGPFPIDMAWRTYESVLASGRHTFRNYLAMRWPWLRWLVSLTWGRTQHFLDRNGDVIPEKVEGINAPAAAEIKRHVGIPVICTGGFQTADGILRALQNGSCDAVSIARPLLANPDLPKLLQEGWPGPKDPPCSYCNRCLLNVLEHPLGCYDERRFSRFGSQSYQKMIAEVMEVFSDKTPEGWL